MQKLKHVVQNSLIFDRREKKKLMTVMNEHMKITYLPAKCTLNKPGKISFFYL